MGNEKLGGYIKLAIPERREAVKELSSEGRSNREIAEIIGVDESTVREDRGAGNPAPEKTTPNENSTIELGVREIPHP